MGRGQFPSPPPPPHPGTQKGPGGMGLRKNRVLNKPVRSVEIVSFLMRTRKSFPLDMKVISSFNNRTRGLNDNSRQPGLHYTSSSYNTLYEFEFYSKSCMKGCSFENKFSNFLSAILKDVSKTIDNSLRHADRIILPLSCKCKEYKVL